MFVQTLSLKNHQKPSKRDRAKILDPVRLSTTLNETPLYCSRIIPAMTQSVVESRRRRIVLYSHDTMGLGHTRRNMLIAQTLANSPSPVSILMITGMGESNKFPLPPNVDRLTLPSLFKTVEGQYQARRLHISPKEITQLRSKMIQAAVEGFEPDVLIVDKAPRGAMRELDATLKYLRMQGQTRCILGLRDVLDEPAAVQRDWSRSANEDAIRDYYDAVWIYGDPTVYNTAHEYRFSHDVSAKIRYTGYLDQRSRLKYAADKSTEVLTDLNLPPGELVLCMVGGGQDGAHLAEAFAQAEMPPETNGVILTGPFMPTDLQQRLHNYAASHPRLRVLEYVAEPTFLLAQADRVISMGGYNTTCEVLSFEKRALIVPRVQPRQEQLIRAERLQKLGLLDLLHPHQVSPQALATWLTQDGMTTKVRDNLDLNGLDRLPQLVEEILTLPR